MIFLYENRDLCMFMLKFFTGICVPLIQTTQSILSSFSYRHDQQGDTRCKGAHLPVPVLDLLVLAFQDLESSNENRGDEQEVCSICLMEFEKRDVVNKLPSCGHVFHMECMDKWLERCRLTCPFCRSSLLPICSPPCSTSGLCNTSPVHQS